MCVRSSFYNQQRIDTLRSEFKKETNSNLLAYWSQRWRAQRSWKYWFRGAWGNVEARFFGSMLIFRFGKGWHSIRLYRMQSSFKEYFQLIVFPKLLDLKLEKSKMRKHTCHLDHHQRSRYVTIGLKNWARKLFHIHRGKLFNSQKEKLTSKILPTNPTNSKSKLK